MKTIEELGISPTPWKVVPYWDHTNGDPTHGDIQFADGTSAFMQNTSIDIPKIQDANIFSAAPDMYVALRELINAVLNGDPCHDAIQHGKAALAKAYGKGGAK